STPRPVEASQRNDTEGRRRFAAGDCEERPVARRPFPLEQHMRAFATCAISLDLPLQWQRRISAYTRFAPLSTEPMPNLARRTLFWKYAAYFSGLVSALLI